MAAPEPRRVTRREPMTMVVELTDGKEVLFEAHPLPWKQRNDLGDALVMMYSGQLTRLLAQSRDPEGNIVSGEANLWEATIDYPALLLLAYPKQDQKHLDALDFDGLVAVLEMALEVNGLER